MPVVTTPLSGVQYSGIWTMPQVNAAVAAGTWPRRPGPPTIGTAVSASTTSVNVAFIAPVDTGLPTGIASYTAISNPGGLIGTGTTSPILVSGLTMATAYTFTVTATGNSGLKSLPSAASNSVSPPL